MSQPPIRISRQSVKFRTRGAFGDNKVIDFINLGILGYGMLILVGFLEKVSGNPDFREGWRMFPRNSTIPFLAILLDPIITPCQ